MSALNADDAGNPGLRIWKSPDDLYLRLEYFDGHTILLERAGKEIWATWLEASTARRCMLLSCGASARLLLRLRGITCLHASGE